MTLPQTTVPDATLPQTTIPSSTIPPITIPSLPQASTLPQSSFPQPSTSNSQTSLPQTSIPQGSIPQSSIPQGSIPQSFIPQGSIPQGSIPQSSVPQGSIPQGSIPQSSIPQGSVPQGSIPQSFIPQNSIPQDSIPQPAPNSGFVPSSTDAPSQPVHHLTAHQMHPTLPILTPIQHGVKLLRFCPVEIKNEPAWEGVHHIYDASGNVVYEARGGGPHGAHTLVDVATGKTVVTATGSSSRIMLTIFSDNGEVTSADYHRRLIINRRTVTIGGVKYSYGHDAINGKRAHSWTQDHDTDILMTEEGSTFHNEWHLHFFPSCSEVLEKALVMIALFEHRAVV
eukprot:Phypoly_transcript_10107.p1 GENE.Phypoly_transcript_10107~~Phypoly_transcript_10107.p1  ORF type:complete len:369 (+),score=64.98 Phypoly_transcript_10107:93-1109(+)